MELNTIQLQKQNIKLYPIYKAISWDLLFYYSISFLFLTQTKGISVSEVLFTDAFYPIFKFFLQIPSVSLIDTLGKRKCMILGNLLVASNILVLILANNLPMIILSQFLCAFGYNLKGLSESTLLYDSILKSKKRNDLFSQIDGKSSAYYYYIDAITSSITGFCFVFNGYLPMILCFIFCMLSALLSIRFNEIIKTTQKPLKSHSKGKTKQSIFELKQAFRFILRSHRLRHLILFYAIFSSILSILTTLRSSFLSDISLPSQYFGIVFATLQILSGISSQNQQWFHNRFRNRTLTVFAMCVSFSMILLGFCGIGNLPYSLLLSITFIVFAIHYLIKGPFYTLIKRYLNSFSTSSMRPKISSGAELCYSIIRALFCFLSSWLLSFTTTSYAFAILGCLSTICLLLLLDRMRHTVGLKPDQYAKREIEFQEIH